MQVFKAVIDQTLKDECDHCICLYHPVRIWWMGVCRKAMMMKMMMMSFDRVLGSKSWDDIRAENDDAWPQSLL